MGDGAAGGTAEGVRLGDKVSRVETGLMSDVGAVAGRLAQAHRYAVITDSNVGPLYAKKIADQFDSGAVETLTIPAGESNKTRETWARLTDEMLAKGFGRDAAVIALGGGVVGDVAGFVAATFMRGIPVMQVPPTLLAMTASSTGREQAGATPPGTDTRGTFPHPARWVC